MSIIAAIYGLEEADGMKALVMELVEGPTLEERLRTEGSGLMPQGLSHAEPLAISHKSDGARTRGLPLDEALLIARQIVEALGAGHEQGIVHRDLKPANIKVRDDGTVKVLDYGLAKAVEAGGTGGAGQAGGAGGAGGAGLSQSPTMTNPAALAAREALEGMTQAGMILGTAAYMSPEQARGKTVDKRTDIWAFGCVLYEMLAGKRAFDGGDIGVVLASVIKGEPDWAALPADVPLPILTLLHSCLEKERRSRIADIGAASFVLTHAAQLVERAEVPLVQRTTRRIWPSVIAAAGVAAIAGVAGWMLVPKPEAALVRRYTIPVPASARGATGFIDVVLSPDGRTLVYSTGSSGLLKRRTDALAFDPVRGGEGGIAPFFSPDSAWIGFLAEGKLMKIPAEGGLAVPICDAPSAQGKATWGDDGSIVVVSGGDLYNVPSSGGTLQMILESEVDGGFSQPHFLPGSKALLVRWGNSLADHIEAVELATLQRHSLLDGTTPQLAATGELVFARRGGLWGVKFDPIRLSVEGTPVPLVEPIRLAGNTALFSAAGDGSLVYVAGTANSNRSLVWIDRAGKATVALEARAAFQSPRLSPDGKAVVVSVLDASGLGLWWYEFERGSRLKLTSSGDSRRTVWSPDGAQVAFYSGTAGVEQDLYVMPSTGGEPKKLLERPGLQYPDTWSPDGRFLVFEESGGGRRDLWLLPIGEAPRPLLVTPFNERGAVFSPIDGEWLAFVTDESGRAEVYVQPFPGPGQKIPISNSSGIQPMWSRDGRELFYREGDNLMSVPVQIAPFGVGVPRILFELPGAIYSMDQNFADYDVAPDGRFLAMRAEGAQEDEIHVVLNWTEELRRALER